MNKQYKKTYGINFVIELAKIFIMISIILMLFILLDVLFKHNIETLKFLLYIPLVFLFLYGTMTSFILLYNLIVKLYNKPTYTINNEYITYQEKNKITHIRLSFIKEIYFDFGLVAKYHCDPHAIILKTKAHKYTLKNVPLNFIIDLKKKIPKKKIQITPSISHKVNLIIGIIFLVIMILHFIFLN